MLVLQKRDIGRSAMTDIGQKERATQNRVIKLFQERLGYDYLGNWEDEERN